MRVTIPAAPVPREVTVATYSLVEVACGTDSDVRKCIISDVTSPDTTSD